MPWPEGPLEDGERFFDQRQCPCSVALLAEKGCELGEATPRVGFQTDPPTNRERTLKKWLCLSVPSLGKEEGSADGQCIGKNPGFAASLLLQEGKGSAEADGCGREISKSDQGARELDQAGGQAQAIAWPHLLFDLHRSLEKRSGFTVLRARVEGGTEPVKVPSQRGAGGGFLPRDEFAGESNCVPVLPSLQE